MTTTETRRGFEVGGRFYPYIPLDDWLSQDFTLARTLTRCSIDDLVSGKADYLAVQSALLAVAVWHENDAQTMDRIIEFVNKVKPADITETGFDDDLTSEGDARPPDADASATPSSSAESGTNSSELD